jgi:riboflavin synthase
MFTGIIETQGILCDILKDGKNTILEIESPITQSLKVDQSIAHDGVCLTISEIKENKYKVVAIDETLQRTTINDWTIGKSINLERAMGTESRFDGHWVQGHVDTIAQCIEITSQMGSWIFTFALQKEPSEILLVEKGSICINGISLTLLVPIENKFSVAIIPYTYQHTNIQFLQIGDWVNIEFDILGKYIHRNIQHYLGAMRQV